MKQGSNFNNLENEDEVDVKISLELLKEKKFIFGFTGIFTLLSIFFFLTIKPTYKGDLDIAVNLDQENIPGVESRQPISIPMILGKQ